MVVAVKPVLQPVNARRGKMWDIVGWVKEFARHYGGHSVSYEIVEDGTVVTITVRLKDIPEERVRTIVARLDESLRILSKGKLPLPKPTPIKEKISEIKEKVRPRKKKINPLVTGVATLA